MTTFPALIPSTRTYIPGEFPHTPHPLLSGSEIRVRHSNTVLGVRLRLTFTAVSSADVVAVRNHYNGRQGGFLPFAIPVELLSGVTTPADFTPAGHQWVYASRPSVVDVPIAGDTPANRHDLVVELVTVPPENTIVSGARITVRATVRGGSAQLGSYIESFASVAGGAASVVDTEADGAAITVDATTVGGAASAVDQDPSFASVSLLLPFNGANGGTTFTDASSNALAITRFGDTQTSTAQSKWGGSSALFDGAGDYLTAPSAGGLFDFGTDLFTVECWIYLSTVTGNQSFAGVWPATNPSWRFLASGDLLQFVTNNTSNINDGTSSSAACLSTSTWLHVAAVHDGTNIDMYCAGNRVGSKARNGTIRTAASALQIGRNEESNTWYLNNGRMNDLRITKGVARYSGATYTVPAAPFPTS